MARDKLGVEEALIAGFACSRALFELQELLLVGTQILVRASGAGRDKAKIRNIRKCKRPEG